MYSSPGWPITPCVHNHGSKFLEIHLPLFPSVGIEGVYHHTWHNFFFFLILEIEMRQNVVVHNCYHRKPGLLS